MSKIFTVLGVLAVLVCVTFAFSGAIQKEEIVECNTLKSYSEKFPSFYLTEWQSEMCDSHGIEIVAPVGNHYEEKN